MKLINLVFCLLLLSTTCMAETLYVTDRILLGVHQAANEDSPIITTIPSGTAIEVLARSDDFIKVKLQSGEEGWMSSQYLKNKRPATAELDSVYVKLQKEQTTSKNLTKTLANKERELQLQRDELSNAKTTIKELNTKLKAKAPANTAEADANTAKELEEAQKQVAALQEQIKELQNKKPEVVTAHSGTQAEQLLETSEKENLALRARIEAALANLEGLTVPTAEELAAVRPKFPLWYWLLLVAMIVVGVAGGIIYWDMRHRQRHGGFRL